MRQRMVTDVTDADVMDGLWWVAWVVWLARLASDDYLLRRGGNGFMPMTTD